MVFDCRMGENMKKVIVVSKTHLDLGFTDFAENIRKKYLDEFIPNAVKTAESVNTKDKKFVWTTGSWLLCEELKNGTRENAAALTKALKNGDIVAHALPFTLHTELLDRDSLEYGLSLIDAIDKIRGKKTISAKMTDVPGHTKALIPLLAEKGIKLLHIGVNGASAMPKVPECFLWKQGESEIVVIYSGEYGGAYKNEYVDDILYFDHTLDNHGSGGKDAVLSNIKKIQMKYPEYEVIAGSLDDYAEKIWKVRDKLPVITSEIGDTWIHGSSADPYKSGALRTLIELKNKWLTDGSLNRDDAEYKNLAENILCLAEHTCGMDVKIALGEYSNYLKSDFENARHGENYKKIEKSWAEQREYIAKAVSLLSNAHKYEAEDLLKKLHGDELFAMFNEPGNVDEEYKLKNSSVAINSFGGIKHLTINGKEIIHDNHEPCVTYNSYGSEDYDYWFEHYSRNLKKVADWAIPDFGKPNIDKIKNKYKQGRFNYTLNRLSVNKSDNAIILISDLIIDEYLCNDLGAPKTFRIKYTLTESKINIEVIWQGKSANRLPESIMLHFYPKGKNITYTKIGERINPFDIVENGNRNLSAVENVEIDGTRFTNCLSPLVAVGKGKILLFDNKYGKLSDGLTYVLYDNIWGTNFPLWYSDNAYFEFTIC